MTIALYDATVAGYLQTLGAVSRFLDKGAAHCAEAGLDPSEIVATRLYPDMFPFAFQLWSVAHHSVGALEGCRTGSFAPPSPLPEWDYAAWQAFVAETLAKLQSVTAEEVNGFEGKDVVFQIGELKLPFTAENFLFSFSVPNFHFHATTAYDILRSRGVKLGKRDYMGALRMKA